MKITLLLLLCLTYVITAQPYTTSIEQVENWSGWNAVIVKNGLISTVTVPVIGARVMQYNLGNHESIFNNPSENGKTYTPALNNFEPNFGGFKNWPAPQYGAGRWSWPPPPILDYGVYTYEKITESLDSAIIQVTSPIEKWRTPGLQFIRRMTIYKNSSRVRMEQTLVNQGSTDQSWSVWDVTQCIVKHPGKNDYKNFWTYFPINPKSVFGSEGVNFQNSSPGWIGEVAPGIYGTQFTLNANKLFADPHKGWICYVDEKDSVAYAKTFSITEGAEYPDDGARIAVYMGNGYEEEEVTGPIENIPAGGGKISFTIDWWAAKVSGPILDINNIGAIHTFMKLQDGVLTGNYGVFHVGKARLAFLDKNDQVLNNGNENLVTPLQNFVLSEMVSIPEKTVKVELRVFDEQNNFIGVLDSKSISNLTEITEKHNNRTEHFVLLPNYPNPFNPATTISWEMANDSHVKLEVYNFQGRLIETLVNEFRQAGRHQVVLDASKLASGNYLVCMTAGSFRQTRKITVLK